MSQAIVSLEKIGLRYASQSFLFKSLDLQLDSGGFYYLTGPSGSGKTTLLRMLYMGLPPSEGQLHLFGMNAKNLLAFQKARLRQEMGIVFQDFKLLNHLTILENVALALRIRGLEGPKSGAQAHELLRWLGIEETDRSPSTLSGGEQQRVAIARAVITRPKFLIADEPTGSVDDETALKIFYLFEELYKIGTTVLVATHSHDLMTAFPYPAFRIEEGKVIIETPSRSPFPRPASFSFPEVA
jgi:cell division transport system ATP-binding protein